MRFGIGKPSFFTTPSPISTFGDRFVKGGFLYPPCIPPYKGGNWLFSFVKGEFMVKYTLPT
ncbi:MAG: hypothetical protein A2W75_09645 [Nitrospinae bacterium RIFCSPLOWO2_12_39_15]|nr:MAG: hypothetical protein A3D97_07645 [Nitrospinae bacterium RIFCSPHIGHO2_12_FULL_39_42]OGW11324.1 MAG: hypothetical protein A2W75_09645 [Nitrospinae bacterium RIFCSPLOWO2_12_39_15]